MEDPLLGSNRKLRQALNAAFDSARWCAFLRGRATPANGPVPPNVAGAVTNALPYGRGIDTARRLLAEAGFPNGRDPATGRRLRLSLDLGKTTQEMRESTELLVAFMDAVGVELVPEYSNWPSFLKKISDRRSQLFRIAWVGDYPDAENFLQLFYGPNASPGPNRCNYSNPKFDELYRTAMSTADEGERLAAYRELQEIVREDSPWIFLNFATSASLCNPSVKGFVPHDFPYGAEKHLRHAP
jgi:ABC-type transport system substrate-binding protein